MLRKTLFTGSEEEKATREGFGEVLLALGKTDERVVALCADLTESTKMDKFRDMYPKRFFEMGITEQAMSGVASGMAASGKIPFMASYAMFSPGRNWEQIRTTIAYNNVPVKIVGAHAGVSVGPDGATHQALEDVGLMRLIPNMSVIVPCDAIEAESATKQMPSIDGPIYLRLTREKTPLMLTDNYEFQFGKGYVIHIPKKSHPLTMGIIGCGPLLYEAIKAARELEKEGIGVTVANMPTIKPLDVQFVLRFAKDMKRIVTVEEHQVTGGLGEAVASVLSENLPTKMSMVAVRNRFGQSGKAVDLYEEYELNYRHIMDHVRKTVLG
jgi:transketolase